MGLTIFVLTDDKKQRRMSFGQTLIETLLTDGVSVEFLTVTYEYQLIHEGLC